MIQAVIPATQYLVTIRKAGSPHTHLIAAFADANDARECACSTRLLMAVLYPGEEWTVDRLVTNAVQ